MGDLPPWLCPFCGNPSTPSLNGPVHPWKMPMFTIASVTVNGVPLTWEPVLPLWR